MENGKDIIKICGCGKPLYAALNEKGERIGVTHTSEDEDFHLDYFRGLIAAEAPNNPQQN